MNLTKAEMLNALTKWLGAWNQHDLDEVMNLIDPDVVFEHWNGDRILGKDSLQRAWRPWFTLYGNFTFTLEETIIDVDAQKLLFTWALEWKSIEKAFLGQPEYRRGNDVLHFLDGKIVRKHSYSKTQIIIAGEPVQLKPQS